MPASAKTHDASVNPKQECNLNSGDDVVKKSAAGPTVNRRSFVRGLSLGAAGLCLGRSCWGADSPCDALRFGLIADPHQDIMHDAVSRVSAFVKAMRESQVDFIAHLGDFCRPYERNRAFLDQWKEFGGPRYHTLGNHDMDGGFSRRQTAAFYGMPAPYYTFDQKGVQFIVLDGNDPGGKAKGYCRFIAEKQARWLAEDLAKTGLPCILFSHQPLDSSSGLENGAEIRKILEASNRESKSKKVIACFAGHMHQDYAQTINGIHYVQINSASNLWLGDRFIHKSYSEAVHKAHPSLDRTAPYKEPLWATVTVDLRRGELTIQGKQTEWVGPSPWELGLREYNGGNVNSNTNTIVPRIVDRRFPI